MLRKPVVFIGRRLLLVDGGAEMSHVHCVTPLTLVSTTQSGQVRHVGSWPSAQIVLLTARRVVSHCLMIGVASQELSVNWLDTGKPARF